MRKVQRFRVTRDLVLFAAGLVGVAYETLFRNVDRLGLLAIFAAMMGLPVFLRQDERRDGEPPPRRADETSSE